MAGVTNLVLQRFGSSFAALCVAALAAGPSFAGPQAATDLAGRWAGSKSELTRSKACEEGDGCRTLTLDVSRCGDAWCGVEVGDGDKCGAIALRIAVAGEGGEEPGSFFKGSLTLAKSTEPYVVEVSYQVYAVGNEPDAPHLSIIGDTGGEFRMFRRSFPFHSVLSRTGPAVCTPEKSLSMLLE